MRDAIQKLSAETIQAASRARHRVMGVWNAIDDTVLTNQERVLDSFIAERIGLTHLAPSTGYGYGDSGRDALDRLFARIFDSEAALVRTHWASGTHVLKTALHALTRPGDQILSVTGAPYETLLPILTGLRDFGVSYKECSCLLDHQEGRLDLFELEQALHAAIGPATKVILVQRSRGYSSRQSISVETLEAFTRLLSERWPSVLTVADNCYCEFVQDREPPSAGISLTAGSLIKNPGGGLAPTGGYVAGREDCVRRAAEALYAPGLSGEVGSNPYGYRDLYQGLFIAPKTVGEALKGASFAAAFFAELGFKVDPGPLDPRYDIVQAITTGSPERLRALARSIQAASPVDSYATPEPWDMPGYRHQVIMAAGTFVQGSSIELSCDAPFAPPYTAYLQGGLTKEHVMLACMRAGDAVHLAP